MCLPTFIIYIDDHTFTLRHLFTHQSIKQTSRYTLCDLAIVFLQGFKSKTTVKLGAEVQLTLDVYSAARTKMHYAYDLIRAANPASVLVRKMNIDLPECV